MDSGTRAPLRRSFTVDTRMNRRGSTPESKSLDALNLRVDPIGKQKRRTDIMGKKRRETVTATTPNVPIGYDVDEIKKELSRLVDTQKSAPLFDFDVGVTEVLDEEDQEDVDMLMKWAEKKESEERIRSELRSSTDEILSMEREYVETLTIIIDVFSEPIRSSPYVTTYEHSTIFTSVDQIYALHRRLLESIEDPLRRIQSLANSTIYLGDYTESTREFASAIKEFAEDCLEPYAQHFSSFQDSLELINAKKRDSMWFKNFLAKKENSKAGGYLTLAAVVVLPSRHLPALISEFCKLTSKFPKDLEVRGELIEVCRMFSDIMDELQERNYMAGIKKEIKQIDASVHQAISFESFVAKTSVASLKKQVTYYNVYLMSDAVILVELVEEFDSLGLAARKRKLGAAAIHPLFATLLEEIPIRQDITDGCGTRIKSLDLEETLVFSTIAQKKDWIQFVKAQRGALITDGGKIDLSDILDDSPMSSEDEEDKPDLFMEYRLLVPSSEIEDDQLILYIEIPDARTKKCLKLRTKDTIREVIDEIMAKTDNLKPNKSYELYNEEAGGWFFRQCSLRSYNLQPMSVLYLKRPKVKEFNQVKIEIPHKKVSFTAEILHGTKLQHVIYVILRAHMSDEEIEEYSVWHERRGKFGYWVRFVNTIFESQIMDNDVIIVSKMESGRTHKLREKRIGRSGDMCLHCMLNLGFKHYLCAECRVGLHRKCAEEFVLPCRPDI